MPKPAGCGCSPASRTVLADHGDDAGRGTCAGARSEGPVIGFVGRIEPGKGTLDLVRVVIGSSEIEHHPWVENAAGLMRHLDVLVLPSRQEPFGTVVPAAMIVGTPVVATRVGGLSEVVQDGVTGRLVAPGDPGALAAGVLEVLARRQEMGAATRTSAWRFGADAYADRVERLIAGTP